MSGGMPGYTSNVSADMMGVRERSAQSPEAEGIFRSAAVAADMAQKMGARAETEATLASHDAGAATMLYEQQPDGTTRLRPLDKLLAVPIGAANRAYNSALIQNYVMELGTDARAAMGRFQVQYANDPNGFNVATRSYIDTVVANLPTQARGTAQTQLLGMSSQFSGAIHERINRAAMEQQFATVSAGITNLGRDIDTYSQSDPYNPRLGQMREQYRQALQNAMITHPDRVTQLTVDNAMRTVDRSIAGNQLANDALAIYGRGSNFVAAEQSINRWQTDTGRQPAPGEPAYRGLRASQFTSEEQQQIQAYARGIVRDRESQRQSARALSEQAAADATSNARRTFDRLNFDTNPSGDPVATSTLANRFAASGVIGNARAQDAFLQQVQQPAGAAAAAASVSEGDRVTAVHSAERTREITRITTNMQIALAAVSPTNTAERQRIIDEYSHQAKDDLGQRQIFLNGQSPEAARRWALEAQNIEARTNITVQQHNEENLHAMMNNQPLPWPLSWTVQNLPASAWPTAQAAIFAMQHARDHELAQITLHQNAVNFAASNTDSPPPTAENIRSYIDNYHGVEGSPYLRRPADYGTLGTPGGDPGRVGDRNAITGTEARARVISPQTNALIDAGLTPSASLDAARMAGTLASNLRSDPRTRAQMEHLIGPERMARLDQDSIEIARILSSDNNRTPTGAPDPNKMNSAWQIYRDAQTRASQVGAAELLRRNQVITNSVDPVAAQREALSGVVAQFTNGIDPQRATAEAFSPLAAMLFGPGTSYAPGIVAGPGGIAPRGSGGEEEQQMYGRVTRFLFGGTQAVPVASTPGEIPVEMHDTFQAAWNRAVASGMTSVAALTEVGRRAVAAVFQPSVISSEYSDRAVSVRNGPEAVGFRMFNMQPHEVFEVAVSDFAALAAEAQRRGDPIIMRNAGNIYTAFANHDIYALPVRGDDANPQYIWMVRPPDRVAGVREPHQPLYRIAGREAPGAVYNANDQLLWSVHPLSTPAGTAAAATAAATEAQINQRATAWVNEHYGSLGQSTAQRGIAISIVRTQMRAGITPYDPGAPQPDIPPATPAARAPVTIEDIAGARRD
jgi:hypothetical protein